MRMRLVVFFELHGCLLSFPSVVYVHNECRKYFTDQRKLKRRRPEDAAALSRGLHSKGILCWKHVCEHANGLMLTHTVHTLEIRDSLLRPFSRSYTSLVSVSCWHITQCSGDNYNMEMSLHTCLVNAVFMVDMVFLYSTK